MKKQFNVLGIILTIILVPSCEKKSVPPSLSTTIVTEISTTAAVSGGRITADGGAPIVSRGVCWNSSDDPTIESSKTTENADLLSFTSNITQLSPNTSYYVRAYATNSAGIGYGKSVSFKTHGDKPASNTLNTSNITINSATLNGSVNPNFLSTTVTFEYGVSTNYGSTATALESPVPGDTDGDVTVKADLSELNFGTTYHIRIKAENALGITYSSDLTFTTLGQVPASITQSATNLNINTVKLNGSVNPNSLSTTIIFEWGTTLSYGNSVTPSQSTVIANAPVYVNADLAGLNPGTTYHFRVKATNVLGTTNGDDLTFKTLGAVPTVITEPAQNVKITSATLVASVNPNYLPTNFFFEFGTSTSYGSLLPASQYPFSGGDFLGTSNAFTGLTAETTYHYRIIAENELGKSIGEDVTFKTYSAEDADQNFYHSVTIGTQTWLNENLKNTHFGNGTAIPYIINNSEWNNLTTSAYCWYNNNETANKNTYGALYNWYAVNTGNLCPTGWHVPSDVEWTTLISLLGGESVGGGKLKEIGITHFASPNDGATNEYGFTALPAGYRTGYGLFSGLTDSGNFWTTTENTATDAWNRGIWSGSIGISHSYFVKSFGFSVRCLKD